MRHFPHLTSFFSILFNFVCRFRPLYSFKRLSITTHSIRMTHCFKRLSMTTHFDDDTFYTHDALCIHITKILLYITPVGKKQLKCKFNWHSNFVI